MLKKVWSHISKYRKKQFYLTLVLMLSGSLFDMISIGLVIPFLGVIVSPESIYQMQYIQPFIQFFGIVEASQIVFPLTVLFSISIVLAGSIRLLLLYVTIRLSYSTGADLCVEIYKRTLYQEYSVHVERSSSEAINSIIIKTNTLVRSLLSPMLNLISSAIQIIGVVSLLLFINTTVTLIAIFGFGILYAIVIASTRALLKENSFQIATQSTLMIKSLQEGLGGIRDILINNTQEFYCQLYKNADQKMRKSSGNNAIINGSPRFIVEAIGMLLIVVLAYHLIQQKGMESVIPILGVFAIAAQKILPALQQCYSTISLIKGVTVSVEDVLELLEQPLSSYEHELPISSIEFNKSIKLKGVNFRHKDDLPYVLKNINLEIYKGSCIGVIGVTGSGKSTLLDIIMGLISPTSGEIIVDDIHINNKNKRLWQMNIAHVPQNIFLSDCTIEENIAFGIPKDEINNKRIKKVAEQAQIAEMISKWSDGYQTIVGEQGMKLSGGQRQRIGIARALYRKKCVLILDEATSALDQETELSVFRSIDKLKDDLTIFIIAHRLTTLKSCDKIIKIEENTITNVLDYEDIMVDEVKE